MVLPSTLKTIGNQAFESSGIKSLVIPEGVTKIGDYAFRNCTGLTSVSIPSTLTEIGDNGAMCQKPDADGFVIVNGILLKYEGKASRVQVPDGVRVIAKNAFYNNTSIHSVTLPDSVEEIQERAFFGCKELYTVDLGKGVRSIGDHAFDGCVYVRSLTVPSSVERLGHRIWDDLGVFLENVNLQEVIFEEPLNLNYVDEELNTLLGGTNLLTVNSRSDPFWVRLYKNFQARWFNPAQNIRPQSAEVQALSDQITRGCSTDMEKARAIFNWLGSNITYDLRYSSLDNYDDYNAAIDAALYDRRAVCVGYARLNQALLQAQNIPAVHVIGRVRKTGQSHDWNNVYLDGRWVIIDATNNLFDLSVEEMVSKYYIGYPVAEELAAEADTPTAWARAEVWDAVWTHKLVDGDLQRAYRENITRRDFCRLAVNLVEQKTGMAAKDYASSLGKTITDPFTDTDDADVLAAYALGIVNGTSATTFNPYGSITRQEAAAMLMRTAKVLGVTAGQGETFADQDAVASWATEGVAFVSGLSTPAGQKLMGGVGEGRFDPTGTYTREQAYITIGRLFNAMA